MAGQGRERKPPPRPKSKWGKTFRSGPGATRTRDLLLRTAGPSAGRRQIAMNCRDLGFRSDDQRRLALVGIVTRIGTEGAGSRATLCEAST
jgi:hypothetical protein